MRVAVERFTRMAPAIEATPENMEALLERVLADLRAGQDKRLQHGAGAGHQPPQRRQPKGARGQREYWLQGKKPGDAGRWLKKLRDQPGGAGGDTKKPDRPPGRTIAT